MGFVRPYTRTDTSWLKELGLIVARSSGVMQSYQKRRLQTARQRIVRRLSTPQDTPSLPFIWSSDPSKQARARAYYFAVIVPRGSKGGTYQRTGALEKATEVSFINLPNGGEFVLKNEADGAEFVIGSSQVPSHYLTGWQTMDIVANEEGQRMQDELAADWGYVSTGGKA